MTEEMERIDLLMTKAEKTPEEALAVYIALAANAEAHKEADELLGQGKLLMPRKAFVDEKRGMLAEELLNTVYTIGRTFTEATQILGKAAAELPQEQRDRFFAEFAEVVNILDSMKKNIGFLKDRPDLMSARTLAEAVSISFETLEWMYTIGRTRFEEGDVKGAHAVFTVLVYLDSFSQDAWVALGFAQRSLQDLPAAGTSFLMASRLDPKSIQIMYNLVQTYFDLKLYDQVGTFLDELERLVQEQGVAELQPGIERFKARLVREER